MNPRKPVFCFKSFEEIKALLQSKAISFPEGPPIIREEQAIETSSQKEEEIFQEAMEGVTPIPRGTYVERGSPLPLPERSRYQEDRESLLRLKDLVQYGMGFEVADTPEYIEGTGYQVHREVASRLHRGDFSIQAYVDLHRLKATSAQEVFERFLKWAVTTGKAGVLIIHGRGLSSPVQPVLKTKVIEWLTRGPWRKWIIAYSSARLCDGGAGATYVLLRNRPASKRVKKWTRGSR